MRDRRELRLNLLENGMDFVAEGIESLYGSYDQPRPHAHKYALLHVFPARCLC